MNKEQVKDACFSFVVIIAALAVNLLWQHFFKTETLISSIFIFGVFIISLKTHGYLWGVLASLVSVLAVNFAFTYPLYKFDFLVLESLSTAVIMLLVATMTSALTTKIKAQERTKADIEAERTRANLLRAISHDLRTPLTSIYGSCSAVIENYDSLKKEQKLKLLSEIREDSEWLIHMVENLLSVTRIDSDTVKLSKTSTVLDELIDTVVTKFLKRYPEAPLSVDIPDDFISIPMDPMLIEQVLSNLLENAVIHAEGMKNLTLKVSIKGENAVFTVADDGCGIPNELLPKLFTGGTCHSSAPTDGKRNNMSIGLSVCNTVIRAHGGKIWAQNNPKGGTSFNFTLKTEEQDIEQ